MAVVRANNSVSGYSLPLTVVCEPGWCTLQLRPEKLPAKGTTLCAGLAASQSRVVFVGELGTEVFPAQGYEWFRSEEVWWLAVRIGCENFGNELATFKMAVG